MDTKWFVCLKKAVWPVVVGERIELVSWGERETNFMLQLTLKLRPNYKGLNTFIEFEIIRHHVLGEI